MQSFDSLIDYLHLGARFSRRKHLGDLSADLLVGKRRIYRFDAVGLLRSGLLKLAKASLICLLLDILHAAVLQQRHGCTECYEFAHARHIDAVVIGVSHLRCRRYNYYLSWIQPVEYSENRLTKGSAAHYAVVDHHQTVDIRAHTAVGHVVDMSGEVVACGAFRYEGPEFDVFYRDFLYSQLASHYLQQFFLVEISLLLEGGDACHSFPVQLFLEALDHTE